MATITRSFQITKPIKLFKDTTIPLDNITIAGLADFMQGKIALGYSFDYIVLLGKADIKIDVKKISLWRGKLSLSIQCSNLKIANALGGSYAMLGRINLNVSCIYKSDLSKDYYSIIGNGTPRDAFNNFEPLVSGDGLLNENTFSISGEDTPNFQQYADNGFTVPIQLTNYMVGERRQKLTGCKKGTMPLAGDIHIRDSGTEPVKIWLQEDGVYCRTGRRKSTSIGYD